MNKNNTQEIIQDIKDGKMVIILDDESRENEGDLVCAAELITPEIINFMASKGKGLICLPMSQDLCKKFGLKMMTNNNRAANKTAFTVSIEAAEGITTGISAADRAHTIKTAVNKNSRSDDIVQPGHVFPLKAMKGGVLSRAGHTEAACDLSKLAGLQPAGVICEIMNEDGTMARGQELFNFAQKHNLKIGKIEDLISYRLKKEKLVKLKKSSDIKVKNQKFKIKIYENLLDGSEHFALIKGSLKRSIVPRVRVISSNVVYNYLISCLLYTSPSPRDRQKSRMPSSG